MVVLNIENYEASISEENIEFKKLMQIYNSIMLKEDEAKLQIINQNDEYGAVGTLNIKNDEGDARLTYLGKSFNNVGEKSRVIKTQTNSNEKGYEAIYSNTSFQAASSEENDYNFYIKTANYNQTISGNFEGKTLGKMNRPIYLDKQGRPEGSDKNSSKTIVKSHTNTKIFSKSKSLDLAQSVNLNKSFYLIKNYRLEQKIKKDKTTITIDTLKEKFSNSAAMNAISGTVGRNSRDTNRAARRAYSQGNSRSPSTKKQQK